MRIMYGALTTIARWWARTAVTAALVLAGAVGCRRGPPVNTMTERHPNGLSITLPRTLEVDGLHTPEPVSAKRTANGFDVAVGRRDGHQRSSIDATVDLHAEASAPPGDWPKQRRVRRSIHYVIDQDDGGSDGPGYTLRAWAPWRGGYVLWRQYGQSELSTPEFQLAWALIEGTDPPN